MLAPAWQRRCRPQTQQQCNSPFEESLESSTITSAVQFVWASVLDVIMINRKNAMKRKNVSPNSTWMWCTFNSVRTHNTWLSYSLVADRKKSMANLATTATNSTVNNSSVVAEITNLSLMRMRSLFSSTIQANQNALSIQPSFSTLCHPQLFYHSP
jgi:hypothetical protein